jgi:hypothetical protein
MFYKVHITLVHYDGLNGFEFSGLCLAKKQYVCIQQVSANWSLWAKSSPLENRVLWAQSHAHSFTYCLSLFLCYLELSSCDRDFMVHKAKNIYYVTLYRKFCQPLVQVICIVSFMKFFLMNWLVLHKDCGSVSWKNEYIYIYIICLI